MAMSHNSSTSTSSAEGAAFPWILEHLLAYPGTYEIPLRTMYTLNSAPQTTKHTRESLRPDTPSLSSSASSADSSPASPEFPPEQQPQLVANSTTEHFKSCLMTHISRLPSQPFSLPPAFITSFVRRCFTAELALVDFTQALTALDYLKDLENRRKRELTLVLQRLGLDQGFVEQAKGEISKNEKISEWVSNMQNKELKVEGLYTPVYIGIRRWTLINEMRLEPFSKSNSIAMLNTLYPPTATTSPTRQLTPHILESQRNAFFRYIRGVQTNGKGILKNLEHQGKRLGDANGWVVVREMIDKYLRTANGVIEECMEVTGPEYFDPETEAYRRGDRRADSGVSFATGDHPSTSGTSGSRTNVSIKDKPLPISPASTVPSVPPTLKKSRTTLEKIAREFRNLRVRNDVKEMPGTYSAEPKEQKPRGLRKMKSTSSIGGTRAKQARLGSDEAMIGFSIDDAQRQRLIWEAQREKKNRAPSTLSTKGKQRSIDMEL